MIPDFPEFTDVSKDHKKEIESFTSKFEPYSDFNFISLYVWDIENRRKVAALDGGLAVLMTDYETNKFLLSFLGELSTPDTLVRLINYAKDSGISETLQYIGEQSIENLNLDAFVVKEDVNNFDYIVSTKEISILKGNKFAAKRHLAHKFEKEYPEASFKTKKLEASDFDSYAKPVLESESVPDTHEHKAIQKLLNNVEGVNLFLSRVTVNDRIAGFSIDETLPSNYAISHFFKSDYSFPGISEFMNREVAKMLLSKGTRFWNWEQDLGLEALKKMKSGYRPVRLLKKYKISMK